MLFSDVEDAWKKISLNYDLIYLFIIFGLEESASAAVGEQWRCLLFVVFMTQGVCSRYLAV